MKAFAPWIAAFIALLLSAGCKQAPPESAERQAPETKAEAKEAKKPEGSALERALKAKGSFTILGYSAVGRVDLAAYKSVEVEAREVLDAESGKEKIYGLLVSVNAREASRNSSFVDYDELAPLLAAMERAAKADKSLTRFKFYQVDYKTRGGLKVTTFNDEKDTLQASVEAGYNSTVYLSMAQFQQIRDLLVKAKALLDETRNASNNSKT